MSAGFQLVLCVLTVLLVHECYCKVTCPPGYFGRICKFKCHCNKSRTCDSWEGTCPNNDWCEDFYFGPGCQQGVLNNFTLSGSGLCGQEWRYYVSDTAVDVVCSRNTAVQRFFVLGEAAGYLCSVYASLGRNVALLQRTSQSSSSSTNPEWGLSSNAVDGNTRNIFDANSSCSQTAKEVQPVWQVHYDMPVVLSNIIVWNRDTFWEKLQELFFGLYFKKHHHTYGHWGKNIRDIRVSSIPTPAPVDNVQIYNQKNDLTMCEVKTYGEFNCLDGYYGLNCDKACMCSSNQSCNIVTGQCAGPCPVGQWGLRCLLTCDSKCQAGCTERWGYCSCKQGESGDVCRKDCKKGTYGIKCNGKCSKYCTHPCNDLNGVCKCMYNRTGKDCGECSALTYGEKCDKVCSKYCSHKCNSTDGSCKCKYNCHGLYCADCPVGRYGDTCSMPCPDNCNDDLCNVVTGHCNECVVGYFGENCTHNCSATCDELTCDFKTGKCFSCIENHAGDNCTECVVGYFGENCTHNCSETCDDNKCDIKTGNCFSCVGNHTGDNCTECLPGWAGHLCLEKCSPFCLNSLCNMTTHKCFQCIEGFTGHLCREEKSPEIMSYFLLIALLLPISVMCCCAILILLIKKPASQPPVEEETEDDEEWDEDDDDLDFD